MEVIDINTARTIQKVEAYIRNTNRPGGYPVGMKTIEELAEYGQHGSPLAAMVLAFQYGQAKGYRQGKEERRKKGRP